MEQPHFPRGTGGDLAWWEADLCPVQCFPTRPLVSSLPGKRERGWRWRSELVLFSSVSAVFPQGSPVLALLSPPLGCFAQELGLIAFSSYSFHGGHLTRNSSYDPSVSTLFSAKGKTPADFANVWKKIQLVGFAVQSCREMKWRVVIRLIVFLKRQFARSFRCPYLKTTLLWVCQPRANSTVHVLG